MYFENTNKHFVIKKSVFVANFSFLGIKSIEISLFPVEGGSLMVSGADYFPLILAQVSLNGTVRLNTNLSGRESLSAQK